MDGYFLFYIIFAGIGLLIFYFVVKAAVRDGVIEALSVWNPDLLRKKDNLSDEEKQRITEENRTMDEKEKKTNRIILVVALSLCLLVIAAGIIYGITMGTL